jgi:hypothetical protein
VTERRPESSPLAAGRRAKDARTLLSDEAAELLAARPHPAARASVYGLVLAVAAAGGWAGFARVESCVAGGGVVVSEGTRLEARVQVPASRAGAVKIGARARLRSGGVAVEGTVASVGSPVGDRVPARVSVTGVAPGSPVAVEIVTGETTPLGWLFGD